MARTDGVSRTVGRTAIITGPSLSAYTLLSFQITEAVIRAGTLAWASGQLAVFSLMSTAWPLVAMTFIVDTFSISGALTLATAARVARIAEADAIFSVAVDARIVTRWTHPAWIATCAFWSHATCCVTVSATKAVWNAGAVWNVTPDTSPA